MIDTTELRAAAERLGYRLLTDAADEIDRLSAGESYVEYTVRYADGYVTLPATYESRKQLAESLRQKGCDCAVVRRTVTYGEWEPVE